MPTLSSPDLLVGLRVLDFTRVLAGPYCTAMLGDLGAQIIKIEPPGGDDQRHMGVVRAGESANFALINRNKQSVRIDLARPEGQALARRLAQECDVLVENFKPGVSARLGIDPERLRAANPRLVYCSISGFGQHGSNAKKPAYDVVVQALSGLMSITGEADRPPTLVGESIGDISAGIFAAWGIMTALYARERSGEGRHIDVAMFDALFAMQPTPLAQYLYGGVEPQRVGNRHPLSSPFGVYAAADGNFVIAAANDKLFAAVAQVIGAPDLVGDARFASDHARSTHDAALREHIERWSRPIPVASAIAALQAQGIPTAPIQGTAAAVHSQQVADRQLLSEVNHPHWGPSRVATQPVRFSANEQDGQRATTAAPALGQHTDAVLADCLKLSTDEIAKLRTQGVI